MEEIVCWYCEYFEELPRSVIREGNIINGVCMLKLIFCHMQDKVCKKFTLRNDLCENKFISEQCYKQGNK